VKREGRYEEREGEGKRECRREEVREE